MQFNDKNQELGELVVQVLSEAIGDKSALEDEAIEHRKNLFSRNNLDAEFSGVEGLTDFWKYLDQVREDLSNGSWNKTGVEVDERLIPVAKKIAEVIGQIQNIDLSEYAKAGHQKQMQAIKDNEELSKQNVAEMDKNIGDGKFDRPTISGI